MYHPSKVAARERTEIIDVLGFVPVRHSIAEVEAFESHLRDSNKYILDSDGRPSACTADLAPWEIQWQLNERALCMVDAAYAVTRYGFIIDQEGVIRRF